jgi:hypothetical protein
MIHLGTTMNSINFKQFLYEAAVSKTPQYVGVDVDKALALLNTHCKNALWMLKENKPIYRGDEKGSEKTDKTGFAVVDTTATERQSQNTSNYYTVILDNHPDRQDFPKRSRSFIASTDKSYASTYGWGDVMIIIPADDAKIGVVGHDDMWTTRIKLFGRRMGIEDANHFFGMLDLEQDITDIKQFDKKLKSGNEAYIKKLQNAIVKSIDQVISKKMLDEAPKNFLEEIWKAYSAETTGHKWYYTSNMPHNVGKTEVWVGGKCVLISEDMWKKLRKAYEQKS